MSKAFKQCVEEGGYIETIQKGKGRYQRICTIKKKVTKDKIKTRKDYKKK